MVVTDFELVKEVPSILSELKADHAVLYSVIKSHLKRGIKLNTFYSKYSNTYLLMVQLTNDSVAIELAKKYSFPRGFPIIWTPTSGFRFYGFYPKFSNDQKQKLSLDEFQGKELQMMLKFSGFLAQVLVWNEQGRTFWTCASKNGIGNIFSADAIRIINIFMTKELINKLDNDQTYICGEVMSKNDMTHGAVVLKEQFVCTCVGNVQKKIQPNCFTNIMDHLQMHNYCTRNRIPVPEIIMSNCPSDIGDSLACMHDMMTLKKFQEYMLKYNDVIVLPGTVMHEDILGDVLEGLVIWIDDKVIKYKFPNYTMRTFGLRAFKGDPVSASSNKHIEKQLDFWVTGADGVRYWRSWLQCAMTIMSGESVDSESNSNVALHIRVADHVNRMSVEDINKYSLQYRKNVGIPQSIGQGTVIVITGPIGSGKSTYGDWLQDMFPDLTVHIDGDQIQSNYTMSLKQERNSSTLSAIHKVLCSGRVPIITCGGGAIFNGDTFALDDFLRYSLGLDLNLVLYLPCELIQLDSFYKNWNTDSIIEYRLDTGKWTKPEHTPVNKFLKDIQDRSANNVKYAKMLVKYANNIYTWSPLIGPSSSSSSSSNSNAKLVPTSTPLIPYLPTPKDMYYTQFRILVAVELPDRIRCGHITMSYTHGRLQKLCVKDVDNMRTTLPKTITGKSVIYKGINFIAVDIEPAKQLIDLGQNVHQCFRKVPEALHITINSGKHKAETMGSACEQFHMDPNNVNIIDRKGNMVQYKKPTVKPVTIRLLDLTYII